MTANTLAQAFGLANPFHYVIDFDEGTSVAACKEVCERRGLPWFHTKLGVIVWDWELGV